MHVFFLFSYKKKRKYSITQTSKLVDAIISRGSSDDARSELLKKFESSMVPLSLSLAGIHL